MGFFRRMPSSVKAAEGLRRNIVHVLIHGIEIALQQRFEKIIVLWRIIFKPSSDHISKHEFGLHICKFQIILLFPNLHVTLMRFHPQIPACKQQAPDRILVVVKFVKYNLFINPCVKRAAI